MYYTSYALSCSLGGTDHGDGNLADRQREVLWMAGSHPGKTSMLRIFISQVGYYISQLMPAMALVTYTLLAALASGLQSRFHPEVLGVSFSKALAVVLVEFLAIRLGCYLLDVRGGGASGVELVGYCGYKFVG
jgi:hypothetical protein